MFNVIKYYLPFLIMEVVWDDLFPSCVHTGVQKYKVGTVTFGLLALLQLGLIIYLALCK